jgi:hypothetical protein
MGADISNIIRSKIADGTLPLPQDAPGKVWAGYGNGRNCDACDEPITSEQRENELDVTDGTLRFHLTCFEVWQQGR